MTIFRIYKTDPYKGLDDNGTVDFYIDEKDEYEDFDNYDVPYVDRPDRTDVLKNTDYSHVDHGVEVVSKSDLVDMKDEIREKIFELEEKQTLINDVLASL